MNLFSALKPRGNGGAWLWSSYQRQQKLTKMLGVYTKVIDSKKFAAQSAVNSSMKEATATPKARDPCSLLDRRTVSSGRSDE